MQRDYYIEFFEFVDILLREYIDETKEKYPDAFTVGNCCCEVPVICFLLLERYYTSAKEIYSHLRRSGINREEIHTVFKKELDKTVTRNFMQSPILPSKVNEKLLAMLLPYRHQIFIYALNRRHFEYLLPLIRQINRPVFLVTEHEISDETDLPAYVTVFEMAFLKERYYSPFLYHNFPEIYGYFNSFAQLLTVLQPCYAIVMEGCNYRQAIIAIISKSLSIPSICVQQGWPSILLSCFRNMQYDYFFTWGNLFNDLWKIKNPVPVFVSTGYMYPVLPLLPLRKKKNITFFLQVPFSISNMAYFRESLDFLLQCAVLFPTQFFCVKQHPLFPVPNEYRELIDMHDNIKDVSNEPLEEIFANTILVVGHFSSCLMEGIVHGCVPFVFDPVCQSRYNPDIEKMELGLITGSLEEAVEKMKIFLLNPFQRDHFLSKINEIKDRLFSSNGNETVKKMIEYINNNIK